MANRVRASRNSSQELMQGALEHSRSEMMIQTPKPFNRLLRISSHLPRTVVEILKPALSSTGQMLGAHNATVLLPSQLSWPLMAFLKVERASNGKATQQKCWRLVLRTGVPCACPPPRNEPATSFQGYMFTKSIEEAHGFTVSRHLHMVQHATWNIGQMCCLNGSLTYMQMSPAQEKVPRLQLTRELS